MPRVQAYAAHASTSGIAPHAIDRRPSRPDDVRIDIDDCGICRIDIHYAENDWGTTRTTRYPVVPGYEIVGRVTEVT